MMLALPAAAHAGAAARQGRPPLRAGQSYGIDVASFQSEIDWAAVARSDISFAYVKATQGSTYVDPYFGADWAGAAQEGMARGAYEFFSLCSSGLAQAQEFLSVVPQDDASLPPAVDLELRGNCSARPPQSVVAAQLGAFVAAVQHATGRPVIYYVGKDFSARYHLRRLRRGPRWLNQVLRPRASGAVMWQMKSPVAVSGIGVPVDLDIARLKTLESLRVSSR